MIMVALHNNRKPKTILSLSQFNRAAWQPFTGVDFTGDLHLVILYHKAVSLCFFLIKRHHSLNLSIYLLPETTLNPVSNLTAHSSSTELKYEIPTQQLCLGHSGVHHFILLCTRCNCLFGKNLISSNQREIVKGCGGDGLCHLKWWKSSIHFACNFT